MRAATERSITSAISLRGMRCGGSVQNNHICGQRNVGYSAMMKHQSTNKNTWARSYPGNSGQALIEFLLLLPLLLLLVVNVVNVGGFFFAWITIANAARSGADYQILGGASAGSLTPATGAQITAMINQDTKWLPNQSSLSVNICQNNNTKITTLAGTCSSVPADPEPGSYVITTTDVTYTYQPFIPAGFQFPNLNVYVTIPPTTVHRRAVMRSLQ
jgi:Flp pilus assembly protein TadG